MSEYIGNRIVPRHCGVWDSTRGYEGLSIVLEESTGDSYISRKDVPAGTGLNQPEYWSLCARFSEQMVLLRKETAGQVAGMEERTSAAEELTNSNKAALETRMDNIEARQDANVTASTDNNANYAAELVDARVGWDSKSYGSLGAAVRGQAAQSLKYAGVLYRNKGTDNLNGLPVNTIYLVSSSSGDTTLVNFPDYKSHGLLMTVGVTDDFIYQVFYGGNGDHIFLRFHISSGWRDWVDLFEGTEADLKELYELLDVFGVEDILHQRLRLNGSQTVNGITFTVNDDGSVTVDGTADADVPGFFNMYADKQACMEGIEPGNTYVFRVEGDTEDVLIQAYVNVSETGDSWKQFVSTSSAAEAIVPEGGSGFLIRLCVKQGVTVDNVTVYPSVSRKFTPEEYYRKAAAEAEANQEVNLKYAGTLSRTSGNQDMDNLAANTVYLVSSSPGDTTLAHFPDIKSHGLILTAGVEGKYAYQIFMTNTPNIIYIRFRYGSGEWVDWTNIIDLTSVIRRLLAVREQLAFEGTGDILYEHIAMVQGTDSNGLTYTLNGEGTITVSGTNSSESRVFHNLFVATDGLPSWQEPGKTYTCGIHDDTGTVAIHAYWYTSEQEWESLFSATRDSVQYTVPEDARGILFRLEVAGKANVDTAVYPYVKKVVSSDNLRHMGYLERETDTRDLNELPVNTVYLISSGNGATTLGNFPADYSGTGLLVTTGTDGGFTYQLLITPEAGRFYLRFRYGNGTWAAWRNITDTSSAADSFRGTNPNSRMLSYGNSILSGSVWINGSYNRLSSYYNAPYGNIANAIGIPKDNVMHTVVSSTGLLYDAGSGSFLDHIKTQDISGYDVVLTHLWTADMNKYQVGATDAQADDGTIAGGVVSLLEYMKESNGQCQLILVGVPPVSSTIYGDGVFNTAYPNGSTIEELDAVMHELAEKYHFVYIDWQGLNLSYYYHDYSDGTNVHANNEDTYRAMGGYLGGRAAAKVRF